MTILTGIVLTVALGAVVSRGDLFAGGEDLAPRDDVATVALEQTYLIDVVANDRGAAPEDGRRILVTDGPDCGIAARRDGQLLYDPAGRKCDRPQRVTYCLALGETCPSARVTLLPAAEVQAESSPTGTPVTPIEAPSRNAVAFMSSAPAASAFTTEPETPARAPAGPLSGLISAFGSLAPEAATPDAATGEARGAR
jgi:hypothetical protein